MDSGDPAGSSIIIQLSILVFFTLMNAFFAGAEMAVVSVNKNKIRHLAQEGNKKALLIQSLFEDSTKFLSTIQVAITFAGFYSSASAAAGISPILAGWMNSRNIPYSDAIAKNGVLILLLFFNLVFGELVPKRVALQKAEMFSMMTVKPIYIISKVLSPFIKLLSVTTKGVLKIMGFRTEDQDEAVTEEEIKAMLEMGSESGVLNENEREMINSVFSFDDKNARAIMVPRRDVIALDADEPLLEQIDAILESRHSKIPVYKEEIDNIIGVLSMKDLMIEVRKTGLEKIDLERLLKRPFFVLETKNTDELFREMQKSKQSIALLVDEYGGFSGIVTIEDLVEEIMGEIVEEYEEAVVEWEVLDGCTYLIDGSMELCDIEEILDVELASDNYDTLSGFMVEQLGYIPGQGDHPRVELEQVSLQVVKMEDNRVCKVTLEKCHQGP